MTTVSNKTFGAARTAVKITSDICDLRIFFAALLLKKIRRMLSCYGFRACCSVKFLISKELSAGGTIAVIQFSVILSQ